MPSLARISMRQAAVPARRPHTFTDRWHRQTWLVLATAILSATPAGLHAQAFGPGDASYGRAPITPYASEPMPQRQQQQTAWLSPSDGAAQPAAARSTDYPPPSLSTMQPMPQLDSQPAGPLPSAGAPWPPSGAPQGVLPAAYETRMPDQQPAASQRPGQLAPTAEVSDRLSPPSSQPALRLSRPHRTGANAGDHPGGLPSVVTVAGSLAVVLGIFLLVAWLMRRSTPNGAAVLPGEVFEMLGRAPMANRQQVHLLRCGAKLLLVCVTPAGAETLTEITDPMEVDRLAGLCRQARPGSATEAFRQVFQQFAPQQPQSGIFSRLVAGNRSHEETWLGSALMHGSGDESEDRDV